MDNYNITLFTAFIAGALSFMSPCIIPILPTYIAILAGTGATVEENVNPWHFWLNAGCFLSGFILVFVAMGATASYFGQVFLDYQQVIRQVGGVFMAIMGIHLLGVVKVRWLEREYRPLLTTTFQGPVGAFVLGVAFTAGWTPCTGPILASILVYASTTTSLEQGAYLLFIYAIGFSVPFLVLAVLYHKCFYRLRPFYKFLPLMQQLAGFILVLMGMITYFDLMQRFLSVFL